MPYRMYGRGVWRDSMRFVRRVGIGGVIVLCAISFQGCGTLGALGNAFNNVIGTANNAAAKTLNAAGDTASKALTPSTYSDLAKKSKSSSRSYQPNTKAPWTSARNNGAENASSNSVSGSR